MSRLFPVLPRRDQGVWSDPFGVGMPGRKHCNQVEGLTSCVDEGVRHPRRYLCHVRRLDGERLITDAILSAAFEQYVRLFGVMHMESGAATGVRLADDERERLKAVLVTGKAVCELAWNAVIVFELIKLEKEVGRIVRFLRRVCEVFIR